MKVIDCFTFFDELDLLEVRLNTLKNIVDVFVLTESPKTFTGLDKPMIFDENKDRFKDFNIVYAPYYGEVLDNHMEVERRQKQYNLDYAFDNVFEEGDVIMYSDCDEIAKPEAVKDLLTKKWDKAGLMVDLYYYFFNCKQIGAPTGKYPNIVLTRPTERIVYDVTRRNEVDLLVQDAGYHFSYFGDVTNKLASWGHAKQYNRPPYNDPKHIEECKRSGVDFLNRTGSRKIEFEFIKDLSGLPDYVTQNLDKFGRYIL